MPSKPRKIIPFEVVVSQLAQWLADYNLQRAAKSTGSYIDTEDTSYTDRSKYPTGRLTAGGYQEISGTALFILLTLVLLVSGWLN